MKPSHKIKREMELTKKLFHYTILNDNGFVEKKESWVGALVGTLALIAFIAVMIGWATI